MTSWGDERWARRRREEALHRLVNTRRSLGVSIISTSISVSFMLLFLFLGAGMSFLLMVFITLLNWHVLYRNRRGVGVANERMQIAQDHYDEVFTQLMAQEMGER